MLGKRKLRTKHGANKRKRLRKSASRKHIRPPHEGVDSLEDGRLLARMSKLAYAPLEDRQIDGFNIDNTLSNDETSVYRKDDKVYIVARGTQLATASSAIKDITTDILLAVGGLRASNRFRELHALAATMIDEVGHDNVILTGHSLGGTLVHEVGEDLRIDSVGFNPGAGLPKRIDPITDLLKWVMGDGDRRKSEHVSVLIGGDPISALEPGKGRRIIWHEGRHDIGAHTIDNFINES